MSSESLCSEDEEQRIGLISNMEARAEHQTAKRFKLLYGLTSGIGGVLVILVFTWIIQFRNGFGWTNPALEFNWHPMLMILGLIFIYSQSMLVYRSGRNTKKKALKLWHAFLHALAFILSVIALKAAFDSHNYAIPPKANLYTLHSWIGLLTVILFAYQFLAGFTAFLFPGFSKEVRATLLPVHTSFGSAIFLMAVIAAMMGFGEKAIWGVENYADLPWEGVYINCIGVLLVSFGALALYLVHDPLYKRVALPEDELALTDHTE